MNPVYQEHFGLLREPFSITPDPDFLYLSTSHREGLAQLVYGIKGRKGFVVLTGEVGTGKTTLIRALLEVLNGKTHTAFMFNMIGSPKVLLRSICKDFSLRSLRPFGFAQGRLGVPSAEFILTKEGLRAGLARKSLLKSFC